MIEMKRTKERVILVGLCTESEADTLKSLEELAELAKTAGAEVITFLHQARSAPDPGTYLGKGKLEELKELVFMLEADGIICDDELSPAQLNHLSETLQCTILDRTLLILDIFAKRASTSEGKLQVELAQLKYRSARLTGLGKSLSRLGGGIGTRGPGEKKLETDRRLIQERITALEKELSEIKRHRDLIHEGRKKTGIHTAAIVGYTNAGKSTLLNMATGASVLEEDALFATLDPTTRALSMDGGQEILLTDTVGFINKLPHHLIRAFRSTLEEAAKADIIIHVADASNEEVMTQMQTVYETLHYLEADDKPIITLLNKQDKLRQSSKWKDFKADYTICGSAKYGIGFEELKQALEEILLRDQILIERVFPFKDAGKAALIRKHGRLLEEKYQEEGILIRAYVPQDIYGKL